MLKEECSKEQQLKEVIQNEKEAYGNFYAEYEARKEGLIYKTRGEAEDKVKGLETELTGLRKQKEEIVNHILNGVIEIGRDHIMVITVIMTVIHCIHQDNRITIIIIHIIIQETNNSIWLIM